MLAPKKGLLVELRTEISVTEKLETFRHVNYIIIII